MADNFIYGIDISHNNGTINWTKVKLASPAISFVYVKATQGVGYKDPANATNASGATNAGFKIGYYHFASLNNNLDVVKDATDEANWFDSVLKTLPLSQLIPVLDIETNEKKLTTQQVQTWISTFLSRMNFLGHKHVMIYSYKPFFDENLPANHSFGNLPLWLAQYRNVASPSLPHNWTKYTIWQYSDKGKVNGINGDCDMNKTTPEFFNLPV
ncbi:MAG TPA: glycoside hydrolase family 25 protein [Bacteroidia bacterium]|nr:glycoside hydrolase family 25 protein [Bacteroidia bacterium]